MGTFNYIGLIIMVIMMIPNIIYSKKHSFVNFFSNKLIVLLEDIFRYSTFFLMIINIPYTYSSLNNQKLLIYSLVNSVLLLAYINVWIRYNDKNIILKSLALSTLPSAIFIYSGIYMLNYPLIVSGIIFSILHISISLINSYKENKYLSKPKFGEVSSLSIWQDEHISQEMLKCHLNPDIDAASRTIDVILGSVKFINSLIKPSSKLIDLGCGPGLYTSKLSQLGHSVTGIDFSINSIEYAKSTDKITTYKCMNYLELDYDNEFDVATMIYCDYAALTISNRLLLLEKVSKALKDKGMFILDVFTIKNKNKENKYYRKENQGFWSSTPYEEYQKTFYYDEYTYVSKEVIVTKGNVNEYLIWDTMYTLETFKKEIVNSDFYVEKVYGNMLGEEYTEDSLTMALVLRKK